MSQGMNNMIVDRFADIRILRYEVSSFATLPLRDKMLLYYLSEAALWGRDIFTHQNDEDAIRLRTFFERLYVYQREHGGVVPELATYVKCLWFASGFHHHYSNDKFEPKFKKEQLVEWAEEAGEAGELRDGLIERIVFDTGYKKKKVLLEDGKDVVEGSSVNFYRGVSQSEVEAFYAGGNGHPLNSRLVKGADGELREEVWKSGGEYGVLIDKIVENLKSAAEYASTAEQKSAIEYLVEYYTTGDPKTFDKHSIAWVQDKNSTVDFINGFIEVYNDPMSLKGTWESIVELQDAEMTRLGKVIAENAQWFEDRSPVAQDYRKPVVKGVSMTAIDAVMLGGDCYPATPIGVNLPNADWIREQYGSKSILLGNITKAYDKASASSGSLDEFAATKEEVERSRRYGSVADDLHTLLHECLGHGSGRMREGVTLEMLKNYGSTIEEARADLYALYFMADERMVELSLLPTVDAAWAHYDSYLRSGIIVQLARIQRGKCIEEAHMRNRALISRWVLEHGGDAVCFIERNGKHYVQIVDYVRTRQLFRELLAEVQRIKSEGDYEAAKALVEDYGVAVDPELHDEVLRRYEALQIAPFSGFVNPMLKPILKAGKVVDVKLSNYENYDDQMLRYSRDYSLIAAARP